MAASVKNQLPRVVHVSPLAFGDGGIVGGGERYPFELARAMAKRVPTTLVTFGSRREIRQVGGLTVRTLPTRHLYRGDRLNPLSEGLVGVIARADVVHVHQWESVVANACLVLGQAMGKSVYATDHGGSARNHWRRLRLQRTLDGFLPVSSFAASFYPELKDKQAVIFGGVDTDLYRPANLHNTDAGRGDHALFVGRLLPHKGIDVLIDALRPGTALRVVGRPYDSGYFDHLRRLSAGKDVTFSTEASDEEVRAEYQRARVTVLPSLHAPPHGPAAPKSELLGLTLLEAMASGCPVICTRTGGMPEVMPASGGQVVEPMDVAALGEAVNALLRGGPQWDKRSQQARDHVLARFTWDAAVTRCLSAYAA